MVLNLNTKNVFVQNRFSIRALARIKGMTLIEASEYWAKENAVSDTADKIQWLSIIKYCEKNGLLDQLFK